LSEGFESLIEPVLFKVGVEPPKEIEAVVSLSLFVAMKGKMSSYAVRSESQQVTERISLG
jgi:hypothetical protein